MEILNFFREIDLFDLTSFLAWIFLNFLVQCVERLTHGGLSPQITNFFLALPSLSLV